MAQSRWRQADELEDLLRLLRRQPFSDSVLGLPSRAPFCRIVRAQSGLATVVAARMMLIALVKAAKVVTILGI